MVCAVSAMDKGRENGALLIAASIVVAIRLRGEPIQPKNWAEPTLAAPTTTAHPYTPTTVLRRDIATLPKSAGFYIGSFCGIDSGNTTENAVP
jgi:hypothetical protein